MEIEDAQLIDLAKLVIQRCRKSFMSVGQLVDDDAQRAALLLAVAADMIRGSASMLSEIEDGTSEEQALKAAVARIMEELGIARGSAAGVRLKKTGERR